jgi:hypothetical protein
MGKFCFTDRPLQFSVFAHKSLGKSVHPSPLFSYPWRRYSFPTGLAPFLSPPAFSPLSSPCRSKGWAAPSGFRRRRPGGTPALGRRRAAGTHRRERAAGGSGAGASERSGSGGGRPRQQRAPARGAEAQRARGGSARLGCSAAAAAGERRWLGAGSGEGWRSVEVGGLAARCAGGSCWRRRRLGAVREALRRRAGAGG